MGRKEERPVGVEGWTARQAPEQVQQPPASAGIARRQGRGLRKPRPPPWRPGRRAACSGSYDMAALVEPLGLERGKHARGPCPPAAAGVPTPDPAPPGVGPGGGGRGGAL